MSASFADFEILIGTLLPSPGGVPMDGSRVSVNVLSSPAGSASSELVLDHRADDFKNLRARVEGIEPELDLRKTFGAQLFDALFSGKVRDVWNKSRGRLDGGQDAGLRLRLWINDPELALLPWELLWDEDLNAFLATAANLAVSRYLPVPEPPVLLAGEQLRILVVVQDPPPVAGVPEAEITRLKAALTSLGDSVSSRIERNLKAADIIGLLQEEYHVLHFLGHGTAGKLAIAGDDDQAAWIDAEAFAQIVLGRRSLRLVVLTACNSGQANTTGLFSGIGPTLVQKGVPAVIAMQYPFVQADTAGRFSQAFYRTLANGRSVDVAVNEARQMLSAGPMLANRDWSTPVLYMGTRSGQILGFLRDDTNVVEHAWHTVQAATQATDEDRAALSMLSNSFQEIMNRHRRLVDLLALMNHVRELRADFSQCLEIVRISHGHWPNLDFKALRDRWLQLRSGRWTVLLQVAESYDGPKDLAWLPSLKNRAETIDKNLNEMASGPLLKSVPAFDEQLAHAEASLKLLVDGTIAELVAFSERTLGRLSVA